MGDKAKLVMCITVGNESVYIDEPTNVPRVGEEVSIVCGRRTHEGLVTGVSHHFDAEGTQSITVKAR